ncbi:MAG TPA: YceI family protein [Anaeromyxobacteraceae bacterium]|nr:YceI family protein [Anaeromyxobacteraceae bacterium]
MLPAAAIALLAAATAAAAPPQPADAAPTGSLTFAIAPGSTLAYRLGATFHEVRGVTHEVEGRARVLSDGTVQVMVRAPVASFDSGNGNRDAHMKEVTDAARFPFVVLKAVGSAPSLAGPAGTAVPAEPVRIALRGELIFHGVARPVEAPVEVRFAEGERATARTTFPVSLTAHGVERPALLFVKVDDRIEIEAGLALAPEVP